MVVSNSDTNYIAADCSLFVCFSKCLGIFSFCYVQ